MSRTHRRVQLALRAATLREVMAMWRLDLDDIDGSWQPLEASLLALIRGRRRDSAGLASNYYRTLRRAEGVPGEATPRLARDLPEDVMRANLRLVGPILTKKAITAGKRNVADTALVRVAGSVERQVLDGGRQTLTESARADDRARGFQRITSGSPCEFCADIAAEGVRGKDADFPAHDHCSCTAEVAWS